MSATKAKATAKHPFEFQNTTVKYLRMSVHGSPTDEAYGKMMRIREQIGGRPVRVALEILGDHLEAAKERLRRSTGQQRINDGWLKGALEEEIDFIRGDDPLRSEQQHFEESSEVGYDIRYSEEYGQEPSEVGHDSHHPEQYSRDASEVEHDSHYQEYDSRDHLMAQHDNRQSEEYSREGSLVEYDRLSVRPDSIDSSDRQAIHREMRAGGRRVTFDQNTFAQTPESEYEQRPRPRQMVEDERQYSDWMKPKHGRK